MKGKTQLIMLLALMSIMLLWQAQARATETRVGSMGGVGLYTHDNSNIFFFPGAIYTYSGQVVGEFRVKNNDNSYTVGVNYPFGDYSVIGAYLNRPISVSVPGNIADSVLLTHTTDIFYGTQMTSFDFGLRLSLGLDSHSDDIGAINDDQSARYIAVGAGLTHEAMDLGMLFELPSVKRDLGDSSNTWNGFGFGLSGRFFMGEEATTIVPLGVIHMTSTSSEVDINSATTVNTDFRSTDIGLGIGLNHELNERNLLVGGIEVFGYSSDRSDVDGGSEQTIKTVTMPGFYMGVESEVTRWLIGRLGVAQVFQSTTDKLNPPGGAPSVETNSKVSNYRVSFGMGFRFSDFLLDAAINEGLFFDGPNFISGGINPMATRLSLTYEF